MNFQKMAAGPLSCISERPEECSVIMSFHKEIVKDSKQPMILLGWQPIRWIPIWYKGMWTTTDLYRMKAMWRHMFPVLIPFPIGLLYPKKERLKIYWFLFVSVQHILPLDP